MQKVLYGLGGLVVLLLMMVIGGFIYLSTLDFNSFKPTIVENTKAATGRDLTIAGDIELEIGFSPKLAVQGVTLSNMPGAEDENMLVLGEVEAQVALLPLLTGGVNIQRFVLRDVIVSLERTADGTANWEMGPEQPAEAESAEEAAPSGQGVSLPVIDSLLIENVQVRYRDAVSGQSQNVVLQSMTGERSGSQTTFGLAANVNGEAISLAATLADLDRLLASDSTQVDLTLEAAGARLTAEGSVGAAAVDLRLTAQGNDIADFSQMAAMPLPGSPDYNVSAHLKYGGGQLDVSDLVAQLGSSDLSGRITLELEQAVRPLLRAELTSNRLDINELSGAEQGAEAPAEETAAAPSGEDDGRVIPDTPLPLEGLRGMDMDVTLTVAELDSGTLVARDVGVRVLNNNGLLAIEPVEASVEGGQLSLSTTLDGRTDVGQFETGLNAEGLQLGGLMSAFGADGGLLEGSLGGDMNLTSAGQTVRDVAGNLNGSINFISTEGKVGVGYLNLIAGDLLSQLPVLATGEDETVLNCVIIAMDVTDGLATTRAVVMDTERMTIRIEGDINLKTEELDLKISPKSKTPGLSLATAIRVGGTFANPSIGPDALDVAGKALGLAAGIATGGASGLLLPLATAGSGAEEACGDALAAPEAEAAPAQEEAQPAVPSPEGVIEGIHGIFGGE